MTTGEDDARLKAHMETLVAHDRARVPPFEAVLERAREAQQAHSVSRMARARAVWVASPLMAAAAALLWWQARPSFDVQSSAPTAVQSPSHSTSTVHALPNASVAPPELSLDFLLRMPGLDSAASSIPDFDFDFGPKHQSNMTFDPVMK